MAPHARLGSRPTVGAPALATARLLLRRWVPADRGPLARINADPEVMAFRFAPLSRRQSDALIDEEEAGFDRRGFGLWAVERRRDRRLLGFTGLGTSDFGAPFCPAVDIGWQLARHAWGQGYATEGARAVLAFAFDELGLSEVVAHTTRVNTRSRAVMARLGMTHDPVDDFDGPWYRPGHPRRRFVLYRLPRPAWESRGRIRA
ncbi:MAG: GNAT family N-acetyltransferase [Acidobacteriota bacterium]|nr:GNAT family N-acetyltransferase [Acidobacteriota bacterium]